jgi:hypothetical protein
MSVRYNDETPSASIKNPTVADNLKMVAEVFKKIEEESAEIAEMLFEYLIDIADEDVMNGTIPSHKNSKINKYIKILNRLFQFSRKQEASGGFRIISREMIESLDKKTYVICMCHDGGVSLDILCDVVNTENSARTPSRSPVRVVVKQMFSPAKGRKK